MTSPKTRKWEKHVSNSMTSTKKKTKAAFEAFIMMRLDVRTYVRCDAGRPDNDGGDF